MGDRLKNQRDGFKSDIKKQKREYESLNSFMSKKISEKDRQMEDNQRKFERDFDNIIKDIKIKDNKIALLESQIEEHSQSFSVRLQHAENVKEEKKKKKKKKKKSPKKKKKKKKK